MNKAAAVFDEEKLEWMNGLYIRRKTAAELAELALPHVVAAGLAGAAALRARWPWFTHLIAQVQERVNTLAEIPPFVDFFFQAEISYDEKAVAKFLTPAVQPFFRKVVAGLRDVEWSVPAIEGLIRALVAEHNLQPKESLQPIRVAVTGRTVSPPLFDTIYLVGRDLAVERLSRWA